MKLLIKHIGCILLLVLSMPTYVGATELASDIKSSKYKIIIHRFNYETRRDDIFRNGTVYVNTIKRSEQDGRINGFYQADLDGMIEVELDDNAIGAELTIYLANPKTGTIYLNCKLGKFDDIKQRFFTLERNKPDYFKHQAVLYGAGCRRY